MGDNRYRVRWKGRVLGRFTRREMEEKLAGREWSVHHEVESGEGWLPVGEFVTEGMGEGGGPGEERGRVDGWLVAGYGCVGLLAVGGGVLLVGGEGLPMEWIEAGAVVLGLLGSACGLLAVGRGLGGHGWWVVGGSVGLALAVMAWMARH